MVGSLAGTDEEPTCTGEESGSSAVQKKRKESGEGELLIGKAGALARKGKGAIGRSTWYHNKEMLFELAPNQTSEGKQGKGNSRQTFPYIKWGCRKEIGIMV